MNSLKVAQVLRERGISIFTPLDFQRIFGVSFYSSKNFISHHIKTGLFIKAKNGVYVFSENKPPEFLIANKLYQPSYISFETALSYYHIIPETIYTIFSATTKPSREFEVMDKIFNFHRIKKGLFFGYRPQKVKGTTVLIAEPEKAIVDYLYFVDLKKKTLNERINIRKVSKEYIKKIIKLYRRKSLLNLLEKIL
ncbi:MAG: hypothetical protein DRP76_04790 [Candidatus Omnitrophota bacterium]|nr:MAG: hypothetical protein DRP76_04790 [Candidatus Omnitrophota bacterium]